MAVMGRGTMALVLGVCLPAAVVRADGLAKPAGDANGSGPLLLRGSFEEGPDGWVRQGEAEFSADKGQHHSGKQSARITVARATD